MPTNHRTLGFLAAALASTFWGCGFFFGKIALAEMGVGAMVLYRFLFATLGMVPLLLTHRPGFNASEWRTLILATIGATLIATERTLPVENAFAKLRQHS